MFIEPGTQNLKAPEERNLLVCCAPPELLMTCSRPGFYKHFVPLGLKNNRWASNLS